VDSPFANDSPRAGVSPPDGLSELPGEGQLELFPELAESELPKRVSALRHSQNFLARFVYHLFMTNDATKSVLLASDNGYNRNTAGTIGWRLLRRVDVQEAVRFFREKVDADCLYTAQEVLLDIIENRERAKNPLDGKRPDYRAINEADRMLGQFKKMFGPESAVTANVVAFHSWEDFRKYAEGKAVEEIK
jgi:hypothetical protein